MRYTELLCENGSAARDWSRGLDGRWSGGKPRIFWRGANPGSTQRISTGDDAWDSYLFVSSDPDLARSYGSHLERIDATPAATILYDGTRDFQRLAKGLEGNLLEVSAEVVQRAKAQGYDAVWFRMQGTVGTVIINPRAFVRNVGAKNPASLGVTESFENGVPYAWEERTDKVHMARFRIGDVGYWVKAYKTRSRMPPENEPEEIWVLGFGVDPEASQRLHGHPHAIMKPTGINKSAQAIMTTVRDALDEFINQQRPDLLWMSDTDSNRGRARLYTRYAQHLASRFGYHYDDAVMRHFAGEPIWCLRHGNATD